MSDRLAGPPPAFDWRAEGKYIVVDGFRVHYHVMGSGPPLLLLHGIVSTSAAWHLNMDALAEQSTVYAVDLLNLGRSQRVPGLDASLAATAGRTLRFLDALGISNCDVMGHSHGGAIALQMAASQPHRICALIGVAPANMHSRTSDQMIWFYTTRLGRAIARRSPNFPRPLQQFALSRMYGDTKRIPADSLDCHTLGLRIPGTADHVLRALTTWNSDLQELDNEMTRLQEKPVLLLWGDRDRAVSLKSAGILNRRLPESQLVVFPGCGHLPTEEFAELFNARVKRWLSEVRDNRLDLEVDAATTITVLPIQAK